MPYPSDLTDEHWDLLEPVFNAPGKRGRRHADDLRSVVNEMLYIAQTGCQWHYLPESFGPWTRAWSQFRRWSRNGTWAQALTVLHAVARRQDGRAEETPSMVVIDTHLARGASNGGFTFHDRGGPYGRTKRKACRGRRRHGLPVAAVVVPTSTHESRASNLMLEHLTQQGVTDRLELVPVDRGVTAADPRRRRRRSGRGPGDPKSHRFRCLSKTSNRSSACGSRAGCPAPAPRTARAPSAAVRAAADRGPEGSRRAPPSPRVNR